MLTLPKYLQNANRILTILVDQPNQAWAKTQRELGEQLGFTQPELSALLRLLREQGRIRAGSPLPGVRGRNYVIELVDGELFTEPILRRPLDTNPNNDPNEDRALSSDEELPSALDLGELTVDKLGVAILRTLRDAWEKEERFATLRTEQLSRVRQLRDQLSEERRLRVRAVEEKASMERACRDLETENQRMRAEINKLIISNNGHKEKGSNGYQLRDILPEDSLRALEFLMKGRPGHYRESDAEVGL